AMTAQGVSNRSERMKFRVTLSAILVRSWFPLLILVIWYIISRARVFPEYALPNPIKVVRVGYDTIVSGYLFKQIGASLERQMIGLGIALVVGLFIGYSLGISKRWRKHFIAPLR